MPGASRTPFSIDIDLVELSYGDFFMKKFIYNDLTWVEAKDACDSIDGLLPYFNTITDLEGKFFFKLYAKTIGVQSSKTHYYK